MGMFDTVYCNMALPKTIEGYEWPPAAYQDFQSKTIHAEPSMRVFEINEDGTICVFKAGWAYNCKVKSVKYRKVPATFNFYAEHPLARTWYTFEARVVKNRVVKLVIIEYGYFGRVSFVGAPKEFVESDALVPADWRRILSFPRRQYKLSFEQRYLQKLSAAKHNEIPGILNDLTREPFTD